MAVNRRSRKVLLLSCLVLSFSLALSIRNPRWQDWDNSKVIFDSSEINEKQKILQDYNCNNIEGCDFDKEGKELLKMIEANEIPYKRKPNTAMSAYDKLMQIDSTKSGIVPYFHTSTLPLSCSCGSHYRLMDLGRAYYPRYLPTAVCDGDACGAPGTLHCRARPYHVRVLRRLDIASPPPERQPDQVANPPLPEVLRKNWVLDTFTVTVACECGP